MLVTLGLTCHSHHPMSQNPEHPHSPETTKFYDEGIRIGVTWAPSKGLCLHTQYFCLGWKCSHLHFHVEADTKSEETRVLNRKPEGKISRVPEESFDCLNINDWPKWWSGCKLNQHEALSKGPHQSLLQTLTRPGPILYLHSKVQPKPQLRPPLHKMTAQAHHDATDLNSGLGKSGLYLLGHMEESVECLS